MEKRVVWLHGFLLLCMTVLMVRLSVLGQGESLAQAAVRQSTSLLELGSSRGTIYDRHGKPLVNREYRTALAVSPTPRATNTPSTMVYREKIHMDTMEGTANLKKRCTSFNGMTSYSWRYHKPSYHTRVKRKFRQ